MRRDLSTRLKAPNTTAVANQWETATHPNTEPLKGLGLTSATTLVMGSMIGWAYSLFLLRSPAKWSHLRCSSARGW